ncbi:MAG: formylmethanofuran dehydrogenase subunit C [Gammaproteobacteria bacterium]|nr:formylmethanofuran dehydrogenase subunit C [Gammaproteobacteria bacterium]
MTGVLQLRAPLTRALDLSPLSSGLSEGLSLTALRGLELPYGTEKVPLGELFRAQGASRPRSLVFDPGSPWFDRLGMGLRSGRIEVRGDAGEALGLEMRGGRIEVLGDVAAWAGAGMSGGEIRVAGNAGDALGGALPGNLLGMRAGYIHVRGSAGRRIGEAMRRGLILVEGSAASECATRMRAGTVIVLGRIGPRMALGMRRGSLVLARRPAALPAIFNYSGRSEFGMLRVLFRQLARSRQELQFFYKLSIVAEQFSGDLSVSGKGEVLTLQRA